MVKFITPITVHNGEEYFPPGTEIDSEKIGMSEREVKSFLDRHGEYGGPALPQDPGNTQVLNVLDAASIEGLNTAALIHKGHGVKGKTLLDQRAEREAALGNTVQGEGGAPVVTRDPLPSNAELDGMNKSELIALAQKRNVPLEHDATKPEIIAELKKNK